MPPFLAISTRIDVATRKSLFIAAALAARGVRYPHARAQTQQSHREDKQYRDVPNHPQSFHSQPR
jgi:hypothetical protein